ncbi:MAG: YolD-like family protein [Eubacterium sp.]|nr:YolD-like family protein [Eubacterium sp.]
MSTINIEETRKKYRDIIDKERPVHENDQFFAEHPKMDLLERAKIFAPFSALRGLNKTLSARIKIPHPENDLTPEREEEINELLHSLHSGDMISIIIRTPIYDGEKIRYEFEKITGAVAKLKPEEGYVQVINERIPLNRIYDIEIIDRSNR